MNFKFGRHLVLYLGSFREVVLFSIDLIENELEKYNGKWGVI